MVLKDYRQRSQCLLAFKQTRVVVRELRNDVQNDSPDAQDKSSECPEGVR